MYYKYKVGQRVVVRGGFGQDPPTVQTIVDTGEKNGRPLYDLDNGHWCYEDQIDGQAPKEKSDAL